MTVTRKKFKTEVQQLLDLVIHSLYSNRDIFLRELISNASDAIDRARFEALSAKDILEDDAEWKIKIAVDKTAKTMTVTDNGIGMTMAEVEKNIGTIASSGTRRFLEELQSQNKPAAPELIGQFGVGFYSVFMAADKVVVTTRRAGAPDDGTRWESSGDGDYTLEKVTKAKRGTEITLHFKEGMEEYLEEWKIRKIVKHFSDFVEHPVVMDVTRDLPEPADKDKKKDQDKDKAEKTVEVTEETLNSRKAIWQRPKAEVTADEHHEFYRHISHDFLPPLDVIHWNTEGKTEFRALVYIPSQAPMDFLMPDDHRPHGIQLYVKRVFITDSCEELMPPYLRFLRGVVDSADLPLNISRELLQENRLIRQIRSNVTKKVLDVLAEMKEKDSEKYLKFWNAFGRVLKEGMHLDAANREKLQELILFPTLNQAPDKLVSLADYVKAMPANQKDIYYATGETRQALENSPHLEAFRRAGFDVFLMIDPIDDWVVQALTSYQEKPLKSVLKGSVDLPVSEEQKKETEQQAATCQTLIAYLKLHYGDKVKEVTVSARLTDSACCLVADEHALGQHMEKILKAIHKDMPATRRILEINPKHPVIAMLQDLLQKDDQNPRLAEYADLLYDQALLTAGLPVEDLLQFTRRVSRLMAAEGKTLTPPAEPAKE